MCRFGAPKRLLRIQKMLDEHGPVLVAAVQADFGMRSPLLTEVADFLCCAACCRTPCATSGAG